MNKNERPKVIINCAMSADGKIALPTRKQVRISSDEDITRVHQLRNECDAILVGIGAVLSDDPKLTVKEKFVEYVKQPIRIVLDSSCKTPEEALVVNTKAKTIIFHGMKTSWEKKYGDHVKLISINDDNGLLDIEEILIKLKQIGINSLLIEGGGTIIWNFVHSKNVDDFYIYIGSMIIGGSQTPTVADGLGVSTIEEIIKLKLIETTLLGDGILLHYQLN